MPSLQTFADAYSKARFAETSPVLEAPGEFQDTDTFDTAKRTHFIEAVAKQQEEPKKLKGYAHIPAGPPGLERHSSSHNTMTFDQSTSMVNRTELPDDSILTEDWPRMPNQNAYIRQRTPKTLTFYQGIDDGNTGSLAWVDGTVFQSIAGFVIFLNSIIIGLETDYDLEVWVWVEHFLLCFFCFELTLRLCRHGCNFFKHEDDWVWNVLDFCIVLSGVFDQWTMPAIRFFTSVTRQEEDQGSSMSMIFMLMRMMRLLRIVRLFRLVRIVRPLYQLAVGVLEAMQGMFWVLVFMVMTLYASAILCTRFIGHGAALTDEMKEDEEIQTIMKMFGSVPDSMFTLFGTISSWSLLKFVPLFKETPILRPIFVLFYVYSAWALISVMTGVVSENLYAIRDQMIRDEEERENLRKANITKTLTELFIEADADGSGEVDREEFDTMLVNPKLTALLSKNTNMRVQDLLDIFDWIDHDKSETIAVDEFMMGFKWMNEKLSAKSLVKLQERLIQEFKQLEKNICSTAKDRNNNLHGKATQQLRKIHAISGQIDNLGETCSTLKFNLQEQSEGLPTMRQITKTEMTLHDKLDRVFQRVSYLQRSATGH